MPPLARQLVQILYGGLDTKTPGALVRPGKLKALQNGYQAKTGEIRKRGGQTALSKSIIGGGSVASALKLAAYNDELVLWAKEGLYSYSSQSSTWANKATFPTLSAKVQGVAQASRSQQSQDSATNGTLTVYVWEEAVNDASNSATAYYSVQDVAGGQMLVPATQLNTTTGGFSSACKPKVVLVNGVFIAFYCAGAVLFARKIDPATPTSIGVETTVGTPLYITFTIYDVQVRTDLGVVAVAYKTDATHIATLYWTSAMIVQASPGTVNQVVTDTTTNYCCAWMAHDASDGFMYLAFAGNATAGDVTVRRLVASTLANSAGTGAGNLSMGTGGATANLSGYRDIANARTVLFAHVEAAAPNTTRVMQVIFNAGSASATWMWNVGLASRTFTFNGSTYMLVSTGSAPYESYFMVDATLTAGATTATGCCARMLLGNGGGFTATGSSTKYGHLPNATVSGLQVTVALLRKVRIVVSGSNVTTASGVASCVLLQNDAAIGSPRSLGQTLMLPGALPRRYDGATVTEQGFNVSPVATIAISGAGGSIAAGTYTWAFCYEWTDARGYLHRSSPVYVSANTSGATSKATITFPTLPLTSKTGVVLAFYRTTASGTVYYRRNSVTVPTLSNPANGTSTLTDTDADVDILAGEPLYTTGGVLANDPLPSCLALEVFSGRMFAVGCEYRNQVWFSKEAKAAIGVGFNSGNIVTMDDADGNPTALGVLDDKLIIFKSASAYAIYGEGPNDLGQGSFATPFKMASKVGTTLPDSVSRCQEGVMFTSQLGIYLLDRGMSAQYVGAAVEGLITASTVTSAVPIETANHLRVTTSGGTTYVYDFYHRDEKSMGQWYTNTNQAAVHACLWNGSWAFVKSDGTVEVENSGVSDDGTAITTTVRVAPISFAGILGQESVYSFQMLGDYLGAHSLQVLSYLDQSATLSETFSYTPSAAPVLVEFSPKQQRCTSIELVISDSFISPSAGFTLQALVFEVGVQPGLHRLPAASRATGV